MARDRGHAAQKRAIEPQVDMTFGRAEQTKWMRRSSTALRGALLGVPLERRGHGADLGSRLATRLGETWRVNIDGVYRLVEQLENNWLAVSREGPTRDSHGRRHVVQSKWHTDHVQSQAAHS